MSLQAYTRTESLQSGQDRSYPRFHIHEVLDQVSSDMQGRPIFKEEERVEVILPGNPHTRPVFKVTDEHKQKWPEHYARFKQGLEVALQGTPVEQWPILSRSQIAELKALGLMTVEHIAGMDDLAMQRIPMGGRRLKELATAYLDDAAAQALLTRTTAENERLNSEIGELKNKVTELGALLERTHADLQALRNAPNPIASTAPMQLDPVEQARAAGRGNGEPPAASALDALPTTRRKRSAA